ncbi:MAG: hypothetical protein K2W96_19875, partial [Gemmataceae bacterium]|nr:hypothetical protein [Gemmataceae bacterium]
TEEMLGKKAKCPECGGITALRAAPAPAPAPEPDAVMEWEPEPDPAPKAPPKKASPMQDEPPPARAGKPRAAIRKDEPAFDETVRDDDDRPRRGRDDRDDYRGGGRPEPNSQILLRLAVLLCGLGGAISFAVLAYVWQSHLALANDPLFAPLKAGTGASAIKFRADLELLEDQAFVGNLLYAGASTALVAGILGFLRMGIIAGLLFLVGMAPPLALNQNPGLLILAGFHLIGGLCAFFIVTGKAAQKAAEKREAAGLPPARRGALGIVGAVFGYLILIGYAAFAGMIVLGILALTETLKVGFESMKRTLPPPGKIGK